MIFPETGFQTCGALLGGTRFHRGSRILGHLSTLTLAAHSCTTLSLLKAELRVFASLVPAG